MVFDTAEKGKKQYALLDDWVFGTRGIDFVQSDGAGFLSTEKVVLGRCDVSERKTVVSMSLDFQGTRNAHPTRCAGHLGGRDSQDNS